ncbi:hypothetical protein RF11_16326 [Thelohanellus kitauei]|uniref:Uncharacterized protein n=1 Tax=Thelohanellus kitauei TaxID=669202 RepID=A0A0C2MUY1_THEKT|nr:hypothetical protein RF11_16326 [Thelohanellus kitauei]
MQKFKIDRLYRQISQEFLKDTFNKDTDHKPNDLDVRIISGHVSQCLAEAIERRGLSSFPSKTSAQLQKWITYLNIKKQHSYIMVNLSDNNKSKKCGHAQRSVKECEDEILQLNKMIKQFESISNQHNKEKIPKQLLPNLIKAINFQKEKLTQANTMM